MKTLVVEHTAPFQALPELVADAEGLFAKEGIKIEWVNTNEGADRNEGDQLDHRFDRDRQHEPVLVLGGIDVPGAEQDRKGGER